MRRISFLLTLSRPLYLLGSILLYSLGGGIARYIGVTIQWNVFFLGLGWILLIQLGGFALYDYFEPVKNIGDISGSTSKNKIQNTAQEKADTLTRLLVCYSCLAIAASFTVLLMRWSRLSPIAGILMATAFLGGVFYSLPPIRLSVTGYGELVAAVVFANIIPALAFSLQNGGLHRLIAMTTFPLTPLLLAMIIAFQFPTYSSDLKYGKRGIMVRMGWQNAMNFHNILIVCAYLLLAIALFFQLPVFIDGPVFLTLPLGALQMWQMKRIADGGKPNWQALIISWIVMAYTVVYLLAYSYWIH
jgi:1,4-dihydroxy-2-naphthoate octaprenyltransferase